MCAEPNKLSDADGFDKQSKEARSGDDSWECEHKENIDVIGFISSLIDTLVVSRHADSQRVYCARFNNGNR